MLLFIVFISLLACGQSKTLTYNWSIDFVNAAPDGVTRRVIGINGSWPCPKIEGNVGDQVVVHVTNNLGSQTTGLHFHGLRQFGTQVMDGPTGVTQCPILPGSSFTYSFIVCTLQSVDWMHLTGLGSLIHPAPTGITRTIWGSTLMASEVC